MPRVIRSPSRRIQSPCEPLIVDKGAVLAAQVPNDAVAVLVKKDQTMFFGNETVGKHEWNCWDGAQRRYGPSVQTQGCLRLFGRSVWPLANASFHATSNAARATRPKSAPNRRPKCLLFRRGRSKDRRPDAPPELPLLREFEQVREDCFAVPGTVQGKAEPLSRGIQLAPTDAAGLPRAALGRADIPPAH